MGGIHIPGRGPNDDGYDEDGYDESQRAEILEVEGDNPTDGNVLTDLAPDLGEETDDSEQDDLAMIDDELGEEDEEAVLDEDDREEDELQEDFDEEELEESEDLDDEDEDAIEP